MAERSKRGLVILISDLIDDQQKVMDGLVVILDTTNRK